MTFGSLSAVELDSMAFDPVRFVVPGMIPEGLTIIAGKPKFGKSFAVLDIAIAVASGGKALGKIQCPPGDVLYCAMEDGKRRLQERQRRLCPSGPMPARLLFETTAPRLDDGLILKLEEWAGQHPDARLIILDTWAHIKPAGSGRSNAYDEDAQGMRPLHIFAKRHPGLAVVVVHHVRKAEADDVFDTISGTNGLTGMADTLMVMSRQGDVSTLAGQGRDIEGYEKVIERDRQTGGWRIACDAQERAKTVERQAILTVLEGSGGKAMSTKSIALAVGKSVPNVSHLLAKLAGEGLVEKAGYGKWRPLCVQSVQCVQSEASSDDDQLTDFEQFEQFECLSGGPAMRDQPCSQALRDA